MKNAKCILLVEDNPDDLELTLRALREHRLANRIDIVRDGAEALDFLDRAEELPAVVLLDLKLPKIDGMEVLRRVKADERLRAVPVVVLTSSREESDLVASYRLGVNSYIVKPVDFGGFSEAVRQLGMYWLVLNEPLP